MPTEAWILEGASIGEGDEIANSLADRINTIQANLTSTLAETVEIEHHYHNRERWRGKLAVQTATDWADDTLSPFRAISGNNAYGSDVNDEALVIGTADTPAIAGMTKYDPHLIFVVDASSSTVYKIRLVYGSGTMAAAIAAGQFSEAMFRMDPAAAQDAHGPVDFRMPRLTCGTDQCWLQCWNASNNATLDFLVGWHEYAV
jgi:hypothetical protein